MYGKTIASNWNSDSRDGQNNKGRLILTRQIYYYYQVRDDKF